MATARRIITLPPALEGQFEDLLGDQKYRDDLLEAVRSLAQRKRVDLERVHGILADGKRHSLEYGRWLHNVAKLAIPWDEDGWLRDKEGRLKTRGRQRTRRDLIWALEQARGFYDLFLPPAAAGREPIYRTIYELLALLEAPPTPDNFGHLLGPNVPGARQPDREKRGKPKRGAPERPDRAKIRVDLRAARVPADLVNPLMRYVGIFPALSS
jgi:hypothetical protein